MFRITILKISLLSAFATLFLLISMLASTGTASAHTATGTASTHTTSCQPQQVYPPCPPIHNYHPSLQAWDGGAYNKNCKDVIVLGTGFAPGTVTLYADREGFKAPFTLLTITPKFLRANTYGNFFTSITVCGWHFGLYHGITTLYGIDSNEVQSNTAVIH